MRRIAPATEPKRISLIFASQVNYPLAIRRISCYNSRVAINTASNNFKKDTHTPFGDDYMNKSLFPPQNKRRLLSLAALTLLVSILASCTLLISNPELDTDRSAAATTTDSSSIPSTDTTPQGDSDTTPPAATDPVTTEPVTTESVTTDKPETETPLEKLQATLEDTPRDAAYISVYDLTDNRLLYTTGEAQMVYPASTTKLFTILYALTIAEEDDVFTVGNEINIAPADSSKAWISIDQKFTMRDLVAAMLLPSGNDAAYTIAVGCGRKLAGDNGLSAQDALGRFIDGMNSHAAKLGLEGSHFVTPDGYHDPDHYTTLGDMATIAKLAYEQPLMAEIMAMPTYTAIPLNFGKEITWNNTNYLLSEDSSYYYPSAIGMKTGYHSDAGYCLIAAAEQDDRAYMVLLFKGEHKSLRFSDAKEILELCFATLEA